MTGTYTPNDHFSYYEVNCGDCEAYQYISDVATPFHAIGGTIYWLVIQVNALDGTCGWKTSMDDFQDSAVYYHTTNLQHQVVEIGIYDPTINLAFSLCGCDEETCPVELSSFAAAVTQSNLVQLNWITESESDLLGYNVLRNTSSNLSQAIPINTSYIPANNTTAQSKYSYTDAEVECDCTYHYWLESVEMSGETQFHGPVTATVLSGGEGDTPDPGDIVTNFESVYPNPFNPETKFSYTIPEDETVTFKVYNLKGQLVETITHDGHKGSNSVTWNAASQASGIYMIHMQSTGFTSIRKAVLIK